MVRKCARVHRGNEQERLSVETDERRRGEKGREIQGKRKKESEQAVLSVRGVRLRK